MDPLPHRMEAAQNEGSRPRTGSVSLCGGVTLTACQLVGIPRPLHLASKAGLLVVVIAYGFQANFQWHFDKRPTTVVGMAMALSHPDHIPY